MARKKGQLVKQPSKITAEKRIIETAALLLSFKSRRHIVDYLVGNYHIQPRSCDLIITQAYEYIRDNYKTDRESVVIKHIEFYYDMAMNWKDIDPRASLKALEQIEKLLKLHQEQPLIQQNTMNLNFEKIETQDLIKAIENIKQAKQA